MTDRKPSNTPPAGDNNARGASSFGLPPALLNDEQAASFLGISVRKFHQMRSEPWMPSAITLGPRLVRWARAELESAITLMPRQQGPAEEPERLQLARQKRRVIVRDGRIAKELPL